MLACVAMDIADGCVLLAHMRLLHVFARLTMPALSVIQNGCLSPSLWSLCLLLQADLLLPVCDCEGGSPPQNHTLLSSSSICRSSCSCSCVMI